MDRQPSYLEDIGIGDNARHLFNQKLGEKIMKKKVLLSICIPAYNSPHFILKLLNSLVTMPGIEAAEIVILDDGSTDETAGVVKGFISKHPEVNINFYQHQKNRGFDKTILELPRKARGKFCWFISQDDLPRKHSLRKILAVVNKYPDLSLIHMNYSRFDNKLQKITAQRMVGSINRDILFENANDFFFKNITGSYFYFLGTNIITVSTDVVRRKLWLEAIAGMERFIGHNFIHCFVISKMIKDVPKIFYIGRPNVQYLANNHRIWSNDIWKDYNEVLLDYLRNLGYDRSGIRLMKRLQKKYERREAVMKNPLTRHFYNLARPVYAVIQYLKTKLGE